MQSDALPSAFRPCAHRSLCHIGVAIQEEGGITADANIESVKELFAAFRRGDFSDVINAHAEDIVMEAPVSRTSTVPWAGQRRGRPELVEYFEALDANVRPDAFRDVVFTASGDRVVVEGSNSGPVVATGDRYDHDWVMVFTIRNDEVQSVRHFYDPADIAHFG